jgi:hypothetical protein
LKPPIEPRAIFFREPLSQRGAAGLRLGGFRPGRNRELGRGRASGFNRGGDESGMLSTAAIELPVGAFAREKSTFLGNSFL